MSGEELATTPEKKRRRPKLAPLHWSVRLAVLLVGGVLIVVGIAGLVLPGIQGILTIVLGLAVTSLASDWVHRQLRKLLARWPRAHSMMERFRERVHGWLSGSRPTATETEPSPKAPPKRDPSEAGPQERP